MMISSAMGYVKQGQGHHESFLATASMPGAIPSTRICNERE